MAKILKNNSGSTVNISDVGISIPNATNYTINPIEFGLYAASANVQTLVTAGTLIVNDGYDDLDKVTGLKHIQQESVPRDTSLNTTIELLTVANNTLTLSVNSRSVYILSGAVSGQIIKLPDALTLTVGHRFQFWNKSSVPVTIKDFLSGLIISLNPNRRLECVLESKGTAAGVWTSDANIFTGVADSQSRFATTCGFDGSASTGRYLEFSSNVDSNQSGFVIPRTLLIKELSFAIQTASAVTFQVIRFTTVETVLTTINTIAGQRKTQVTGLNITMLAGEEIRVKCSAGTGSRTVFAIFMVYV